MEKVTKRKLDILSILIKRLGDKVGKETHDKIFKGKVIDKRKELPADTKK